MTGALGSGFICYIVPAANHLLLYFGYAKCSASSGSGTADLLDNGGEQELEASLLPGYEAAGVDGPLEFIYPSYAEDGCTLKSVVLHMLVPTFLLLLGLFTSLAVLANFDIV